VAARYQQRDAVFRERPVFQQVHRDMPDEMVDPVQRLVQCVPERLGAGQTDDEGAHQPRADGHGDAVDLR
jgi:hypothetical protein